ncbi:hypothetical protein phiA034_gene0066 [Aeromonas phage phiA034]|uniref:Uncharacterized protein n=1 Tax=Aeromonas phage phiA034 TaxID=2985287 RepID=A0AAE9YHV9_9CAUD|nr:hypothetical protein phiA034_gene0066 [Aeromonas phage phiA034]
MLWADLQLFVARGSAPPRDPKKAGEGPARHRPTHPGSPVYLTEGSDTAKPRHY